MGDTDFARQQAELLARLEPLLAVMVELGKTEQASVALRGLLHGMMEARGNATQLFEGARLAESLLRAISLEEAGKGVELRRQLRRMGGELSAHYIPEAATWTELSSLIQADWVASKGDALLAYRGTRLIRIALIAGRALGTWEAAGVTTAIEANDVASRRHAAMAKMLESVNDPEGAAAAALRSSATTRRRQICAFAEGRARAHRERKRFPIVGLSVRSRMPHKPQNSDLPLPIQDEIVTTPVQTSRREHMLNRASNVTKSASRTRPLDAPERSAARQYVNELGEESAAVELGCLDSRSSEPLLASLSATPWRPLCGSTCRG